MCLNEQLISEMQERKKRENNIIIVGICEQTSAKAQERMLKDENDVVNIISAACQGIAKPIKVYRIGKYNPGKNRRIKICFDKPEPALTLLRNKIKFPDNIKIYSDQTPAQQKYFQSVKDELTQRIKAGENDIIIKYINGVPTIVKSVSKNSNQQ